MANIKLTIEYDGTDFQGWQVQPKGSRTVQAVIRDTFFIIFGEKITLIGSGRTDSGVHAAGQVANFTTVVAKPPEEIRNALNAHLPADIAILKAERVADHFHAQFDAKTKTYRYMVLNRTVRSPLRQRQVLLYPYPLEVPRMKEAASALTGKHDFSAFKGLNRSNRDGDNTRLVSEIRITRTGDLVKIDVTANGFLYKMVRNIVGTLLACGQGKISPQDVAGILRQKERTKAPAAAPAHGLCLMKVSYRNGKKP